MAVAQTPVRGGDRPRPAWRPDGQASARSSAGTRVENAALYAGVFFAPFLDLSSQTVFITLSDVFFCVAMAILLFRRCIPRAPLGFLTLPWFLAYLMVAGGLYVSSMLKGDPERGIILLLQYSFCFIILPHLLLGRSEQQAYRLIYVYLAGVIVLDVHGIATFYLVGYTPESPVVSGSGRLETLTGSTNAAACLNGMMIVVVLWLTLAGRLRPLLGAVLVCVMLFTIVLTSSNGGLIATFMGLLIFLGFSLSSAQLLKAVPLLAIPVIFLLAGGTDYLPEAFHERVLVALTTGDVSAAGTFEARNALIHEALDLINAERVSWLGIGADQFRVVSVQEAPVHNSFLLLWAEGGLLSLLGWLLFCSIGFMVWGAAQAKGLIPYGRSAVLASFAVFMIVANVSAHIYARYWYAALLIVMQPILIELSKQVGAQRRKPTK